MPNNNKEMRYFFGKINFVWCFITGFSKVVKPLNDMMMKDTQIEWILEVKEAFTQIKQAIMEASVLDRPD